MRKYYYEIEFVYGRKIRRENVSKKIAMAIYDAMSHEMILFGVKHISCGVMRDV